MGELPRKNLARPSLKHDSSLAHSHLVLLRSSGPRTVPVHPDRDLLLRALLRLPAGSDRLPCDYPAARRSPARLDEFSTLWRRRNPALAVGLGARRYARSAAPAPIVC